MSGAKREVSLRRLGLARGGRGGQSVMNVLTAERSFDAACAPENAWYACASFDLKTMRIALYCI